MPEQRSVSREVCLFFAICMLDLLSSAWLFHHHLATEANPVLRPAAEAGIFPFVSAKALTFVPALAVAQWYGRRRPEFVRPLLRIAATFYVAIYVIMVVAQFVG